MSKYTKEDIYNYIQELQENIDYNEGCTRFIVAPIDEKELERPDINEEILELPTNLFNDLFDSEDEVIINIEARDADLEEDYNVIAEDNIIDFYSQLVKNDNDVDDYIKTYSIYYNEDGTEGFSDYNHVDIYTEDGTKEFVEIITNYIMIGKAKDFELLGFVVGKFYVWNEHNVDEIENFIIEDKVTIINKTKNIIISLENRMNLDVLAKNPTYIDEIKNKYANTTTN